MMITEDTDISLSKLYNKDFVLDVFDTNNFLRLPKGHLKANLAFREGYSERRSTKGNYLFISGERSPHELDPSCKHYHRELKPGPQGKDLDLDKEWRTYNRKEVKIMNTYLLILGSEIECRALNNDKESWDFPDFYKILSQWLNRSGYYERTFSPYAGCNMCKCSPGFRLKGIDPAIRNVSMHVEFKECE